MPIPTAATPNRAVIPRYISFMPRRFSVSRIDRSLQTAERAKPARPEGDTASGVSCRSRRGGHHHPAGRVLEHEVHRPAEDPAAAAVHVPPGRTHDDDL